VSHVHSRPGQKQPSSSRNLELRTFLRERRARLEPADYNFSASRRTPGLRRSEVAELVGVSERWYAIFESGVSDRRFSFEFVQRVANALRLDEDERLVFYRLALTPVEDIASKIEGDSDNAAIGRIARVRDFARTLRDEQGFRQAAAHAAETLHAIVGANCVTVVSIAREGEPASGHACGPRSDYWGADCHQVAVEAHKPLARGEIAVRNDGPLPDGLEKFNDKLRIRSALVAPLYRKGTYRGVIESCWLEPNRARAFEIKALEMILAILELAV
jgi:transcriptional regulator with XRE-family HTH domain